MLSLMRELRYAIRSLLKDPGIVLVTVVTLALGIAANAIVFSLVNTVLLRSLPYPGADRLVVMHWKNNLESPRGDVSAPAFFLARDYARSLEAVSAIYPLELGSNMLMHGQSEYVRTALVSKDFFRLLGAAPIIGRSFLDQEEQPNGPRVAILSYGLWERDFNKDPQVEGRRITINDASYTVIGIMPAQLLPYPEADAWLPLQFTLATAEAGNNYRVIARLKKGSTLQSAESELNALSRDFQLGRLRASSDRAQLGLQKLQDFEVKDVRSSLMLLFGAVIFILLITCSNLAVLLLVRALGRSHETAIRIALGSDRIKLIRMFLLESLLLSAAGGVMGMILAKEAIPIILSLISSDLPVNISAVMHWHVVLFTVAVCFAISLIFGVSPVLRLFRLDLNEILRQAPRGVTRSTREISTGQLLVSIQMALTLVLLAGATLMFRSFMYLRAVPPGFDPHGRFVAQMTLTDSDYATTAATARPIKAILQQLQQLPEVESAASSDGFPLEQRMNWPVYPEERPESIEHAAEFRIVTPGYFQAMHIPFISGTDFSSADGSNAAPVAIIDQTMARRWWPQQSATGHYLKLSEELGPKFQDRPRKIIGVAADTHAEGLNKDPVPTVFIPLEQSPDNITAFANKLFPVSIIVSTRGQGDISDQIRRTISSFSPNTPIISLQPMTRIVEKSLALSRSYAYLSSAFSSFALALSALALYGLLSYQTCLRTREIALRIAVGAGRNEIISLVIKQAIKPVAIGAVIGLAASAFINKYLATMLYNLKGAPIELLLSAIVLLGLTATSASLLTAFRAASIEPMLILRKE